MSFDPSVFGEDAISAETRGVVAAAVAMREQTPSLENTDLAELRRLMEEGGGVFPAPPPVDCAEDRETPGMGEGASVRIIRPEGRAATGVYLDIHGGGWVIGRARMSDQANLALVNDFGLATVGVDYRLAPEHPYPAAPDDCEAAALWLVENAAAEFGTERILIGGGSAGAHLAAVTLLRMRDRHGYTGFLGANLVYGVYDLSMTPSQRLGVGPEGGLARDAIEAFYRMFIPGVDPTDADVSPLNANLRDMPPALFTVGTYDPLLDDSLFMHARWLAAGNASELAVYPGGPHGFDAMPLTIGRQATARILAFIGERLGEGASVQQDLAAARNGDGGAHG